MAAVLAGGRPNIEAIQSSEYEVFARTWVERCWNGEPDQRPTFHGELSASIFMICNTFTIDSEFCSCCVTNELNYFWLYEV